MLCFRLNHLPYVVTSLKKAVSAGAIGYQVSKASLRRKGLLGTCHFRYVSQTTTEAFARMDFSEITEREEQNTQHPTHEDSRGSLEVVHTRTSLIISPLL